MNSLPVPDWAPKGAVVAWEDNTPDMPNGVEVTMSWPPGVSLRAGHAVRETTTRGEALQGCLDQLKRRFERDHPPVEQASAEVRAPAKKRRPKGR